MLIDRVKLTMSQGARRVGVSTPTMWRWKEVGVRGRRLPTFLVGGRRYVLLDDLKAFVAAGREPTPPTTSRADVSDRAATAEAELARRGV